jgi:hypothetical protein
VQESLHPKPDHLLVYFFGDHNLYVPLINEGQDREKRSMEEGPMHSFVSSPSQIEFLTKKSRDHDELHKNHGMIMVNFVKISGIFP